MSRIAKINGDSSSRYCTVHLNRELGEYCVKLWLNGKHHAPADYLTDDKDDSLDTARSMARCPQKVEA